MVKSSFGSEETKWRLVVDYRHLNNVMQYDKFPLPKITEILDSLANVYFSKFALSQNYYQVSDQKISLRHIQRLQLISNVRWRDAQWD